MLSIYRRRGINLSLERRGVGWNPANTLSLWFCGICGVFLETYLSFKIFLESFPKKYCTYYTKDSNPYWLSHLCRGEFAENTTQIHHNPPPNV